MIKDVSENLHTFFVPQMEQLGGREQPAKHGSLNVMESEMGHGMLWAHSISDECLFTFHDFTLNEPVDLTEFPEDYFCLSSMADCSAKHCPVSCRHLRDRNLMSFYQKGGVVTFTLNPGERHRSYTLCMTPAFFDELEGVTDKERELLMSYLRSSDANTLPREIGMALESLNPSWATRAGGNVFAEAKAKEALACALSAAAKDAEEGPRRQSSEDRRIAREAQMIIDERFSENLSLQSIARELYVGKTRLCGVFREQIGFCVAEYLRNKRMSEARLLLETTDMKAAEIADAIGYAHQSSFTGAFRKACGCSPSQWRKEHRAQ